MENITITAIPAYGRDYKSKAEVVAAWDAGKDFIIQGIMGGHGRAVNKSDADHPDYGVTGVRIRYAGATKVHQVK
jgi:hypothetical protein